MTKDRPTKTLYRFLNPLGTRLTLETGMLRLGRLAEFNDPFDFSFGFDPDSILPENIRTKTLDDYLLHMQSRFGVLCFCEEWTDPVLWGHYADKHHGAALEFSLEPDVNLWIVKYDDERPWCPTGGASTADEVFTALKRAGQTKAASWAYEKEIRLIISLDDCQACNGSYLMPFHEENVILTKIILGFRSGLEEAYLRKAIKGKPYENVPICRTLMSTSGYSMEIK